MYALVTFSAIFIAVLFTSFPAAKAQDISSTVTRIAPAVVVISDSTGRVGSGFITSSDGLIVTNLHVLIRMKKLKVTFSNGESSDQILILGYDANRDLAILKVPFNKLPFLRLGNSTQVKVGQRVIVVGAPRGLAGTTTTGIISAIRDRPGTSGTTLLQTDAAVSPGNSGGPLVNERGDVVGVIVSQIRDAQNLNFAIPINYVRELLGTVKQRLTLDELRQQLAMSDWAPEIFAKYWVIHGQERGMAWFSGGVYDMSVRGESFRLTYLPPIGEEHLGILLELALSKRGAQYQGVASGQVNCETPVASGQFSWTRQDVEVLALEFDRIQVSFSAADFPDRHCAISFKKITLTFVPAGEGEVPKASGFLEFQKKVRAEKQKASHRKEQVQTICREVRNELAMGCATITPFNMDSCRNLIDASRSCAEIGL